MTDQSTGAARWWRVGCASKPSCREAQQQLGKMGASDLASLGLASPASHCGLRFEKILGSVLP